MKKIVVPSVLVIALAASSCSKSKPAPVIPEAGATEVETPDAETSDSGPIDCSDEDFECPNGETCVPADDGGEYCADAAQRTRD